MSVNKKRKQISSNPPTTSSTINLGYSKPFLKVPSRLLYPGFTVLSIFSHHNPLSYLDSLIPKKNYDIFKKKSKILS
jgi:hypothetical protein